MFYRPIYVPELDKTFQPVLRCGAQSAREMITVRWPSYIDNYRHGTVVIMRRNPYDRMESTYRWELADRKEPFHVWCVDVCSNPQTDPHLLPQAEFKGDVEIKWDWDAFADMFGIADSQRQHIRLSKDIDTTWDEKSLETFENAYGNDIRMWG